MYIVQCIYANFKVDKNSRYTWNDSMQDEVDSDIDDSLFPVQYIYTRYFILYKNYRFI